MGKIQLPLKANLNFYLYLVAIISFVPRRWAWDHTVHQTVVIIPQERCTPGAQKAGREMLVPDQDLADVSTGAEANRWLRLQTPPWHFFNLHVFQDQSEYAISDVCPLLPFL